MSAPYGEGRPGAVFIYSGQNGSPIPVLSETIVGSDLNLEGELLDGLTSFGAFIEGNTDIDGNCHDHPPLVTLPHPVYLLDVFLLVMYYNCNYTIS